MIGSGVVDNDGLKKIDLLRERMGIGYQEAAELLHLTEGSVVDALVLAEARQRKTGTTWEVRARDAAGKLREVSWGREHNQGQDKPQRPGGFGLPRYCRSSWRFDYAKAGTCRCCCLPVG